MKTELKAWLTILIYTFGVSLGRQLVHILGLQVIFDSKNEGGKCLSQNWLPTTFHAYHVKLSYSWGSYYVIIVFLRRKKKETDILSRSPPWLKWCGGQHLSNPEILI